MGEVYRARDTRLGRDVALKVLPPSVTGDAAARERFEREARLIASLQHPHICVLHDVGHTGDTPYLVMELLAGETLDARLARGRLPLDDALAIAAQIAQALDAAHRHGIVHRDLKPANVMLQKSTGTIVADARIARDFRGGTWLRDDTIVFSMADERGTTGVPYSLRRVPAAGGAISTVASAPDLAFVWPQVLPDQTHILCTTMPTGGAPALSLSVVSLATGQRTVVLEDAYFGRYTSTGHLLFVRQGALLAQRFDLERMRPDGPVETIADAVGNTLSAFAADVAVAAAADVMMWAPPRPRELALAVVDRQGTVVRRLPERKDFRQPRLSRNGSRLVIATERPRRDIWALDLERDVLAPLVSAQEEDETPVWSADGTHVMFHGVRNGKSIVLEVPADGSGPERTVYRGEHHLHVNDVAADGSYLLVNEGHPETGQDIVKVALDGSGRAEPFVRTRFEEYGAAISPDGRQVAYVSTETGRPEVFVRGVATATRVQVSRSGGREPVWSLDGRELVFRQDRAFVSVAVPSGSVAPWGAERRLFELATRAGNRDPSYALLPDGRLLVMLADENIGETAATVLVNRLSGGTTPQ